MRRAANILSLAVIAACTGTLLWVLLAPSPITRRSAFPVGDARTVHFGAPPEDEAGTDPHDQLRDWLLYAVLEEKGLDATALRKSLYDVPMERTGFSAPVAAFEFGLTRFRIIDGGTVVALLPRNSDNKNDQLAQIADAARAILGVRPRDVEVYEYSVNAAELTGTVTRLPDIPGERLYTGEYGYKEEQISSPENLGKFLAEADDLSSVELRNGTLWASGRSTGLKVGRMRVEDVAALWQSEEALAADKAKLEEFDSRWRSQDYLESVAEEEYRRQLAAARATDAGNVAGLPLGSVGDDGRLNLNGASTDDFMRLWNAHKSGSSPDLGQKYPQIFGARSKNNTGSLARPVIEARFRDRDYVQGLLQKRHDADELELRKSLSSKGSEGVPDGSGFSLDPSFDYGKLNQLFDRFGQMFTGGSPEELANIREHLRNKDEGPFLEAIYKFSHDKNNPMGKVGGKLAEAVIFQAKFQHARYDGSLAGTEDGMVLFYTDLLAKLWALDYFDRAPEQQIRGFVPLLKVSISPIYNEEEEELSNTRLWFGPRDSGYSKGKDWLAFSRVATRVYAASSNTLQPGKEAEANASSARFLGWWNDHYARVAEYEPQYKRLNEIMKWSVVLGWLPEAGGADQVSYLTGIPVKRTNWFPQWAQHNQDLRFRDWTRESHCAGGGQQKVAFYPKGHMGVETESMPLLYSCEWRNGAGIQAYSGGVSLGSRSEIEGRAALADTVDEAARRANLEPITAEPNDAFAFRNTDKTDFHFLQSPRDSAAVRAVATVKLRGTDAEIKGGPLESDFRRNSDGLTIDLSANGRPMSELVVRHRPGTTDIDVFDRPRLQETARAVGRTIGRAVGDGEKPVVAVAARPEVDKAVEVNNTLYVEMRDTPGIWIRFAPEGDPRANIADGVDMRMGFTGGSNGRDARWGVTFIDPNTAREELSHGGRYLVAEDPPGGRLGVAFSVMGRGPPPPPGKTLIMDFGDGPPEKRDVLAWLDGGSRGHGAGSKPPNGPGDGGGAVDAGGGGNGFFGPDDVARKAAQDPNSLLLWMAKNRRAALDHADKLIEQGKFEEAGRELDDLVLVMPNDPDILLLRAIAKAASDSADRAAAAAALKVDVTEMPDFAARLDAAVMHAPVDRSDDLRALFVGTAAKSKGKQVHYFYKRDGSVGVEVAILDARKNAEITTGTADLRYTLATQDTVPSAGVPGAIPPPSRPLRIQDTVIAQLEPDRIYDSASGNRYDRSVAAMPHVGILRNRFQNLWYSYSSCESLSPEMRTRRQDCRDTVVIDTEEQDNRAAR